MYSPITKLPLLICLYTKICINSVGFNSRWRKPRYFVASAAAHAISSPSSPRPVNDHFPKLRDNFLPMHPCLTRANPVSMKRSQDARCNLTAQLISSNLSCTCTMCFAPNSLLRRTEDIGRHGTWGVFFYFGRDADPGPKMAEKLGSRCVLHRAGWLPRAQQLPGPVFVFCHYIAAPAPARLVAGPQGRSFVSGVRHPAPKTAMQVWSNCSSSCWIFLSEFGINYRSYSPVRVDTQSGPLPPSSPPALGQALQLKLFSAADGISYLVELDSEEWHFQKTTAVVIIPMAPSRFFPTITCWLLKKLKKSF